jgi:probable rRNA maturation factor
LSKRARQKPTKPAKPARKSSPKPRSRAEPARTAAAGVGIQAEILVRSARWRRQPRATGMVKSAILAAAKAASTGRVELAIVLSHDSAIQALNRDWRGKNAPTNVLSFPSAPARPRRKGGKGPSPSPYIGDIVIAYETTAREAAAEGKPFSHHLAHLAVHGFLHLLGYDHENDRDAEAMERLERRILRRMAIPDPYAPRDRDSGASG